jgi:predicted double-glycine peptidase
VNRHISVVWVNGNRLIGLLVVVIALVGFGAHGRAQAAAPVQSLLEQRQENVVLQQWDLSCGAAALATILNYQHGDPVSEREVAIGMMGRQEYLDNPAIVTYREGFSLLDLKRFVDRRGYNGVGLGQLSLSNLVEYAPIIVPISVHGYNHFVVFRGMLNDRVLLADPAFGNREMSRARFEKAWLQFPEIGKVGFYVERTDGLIPPNRLQPAGNESPPLN